MPSLSELSVLSAFNSARNQSAQEGAQEMQQVGALQGILAQHQKQQMQQQALQEQQEMKGTLARVAQETGGDPAKMVPALLKMGTPTSIKLAEGMRGLLPKPAEDRVVAPGGALVDPTGNVKYQAPFKPAEPKPPTMRTRIQGETQIQEEYNPETKQWAPIGQGPRFARQVAPVVVAGGGGNSRYAQQGALDPVKDQAELRDLAIQSLYDPNSLAGFRRDTKTMGAIQRERIKAMREAGITSEDVVSGRAGFKADTTSLNKITPQYDAITAFEKTAIRNGKILIELADKVDVTGVPVLERWIRAGRKEIGGDPDVAKLHAQMNLYRAEAARILTQPNLSGVLTDTARKEMEEVMSNRASATQIRETVNLLERDFNNRKETLEEQISSIRARMRNRVSPGGEAPAVAPTAPTVATPVSSVREFATEAEAIKSGVKGKVKIGGRNATIQ